MNKFMWHPNTRIRINTKICYWNENNKKQVSEFPCVETCLNVNFILHFQNEIVNNAIVHRRCSIYLFRMCVMKLTLVLKGRTQVHQQNWHPSYIDLYRKLDACNHAINHNVCSCVIMLDKWSFNTNENN